MLIKIEIIEQDPNLERTFYS